jgi:flagella basal body P-ring formation protein FlgA
VGLDAPLTQDNLEAVPLLAKGASVTLEYKGPTVCLAAPAEALADAAMGQVVAVRNLASGKTVQAVVTGENTVQAR